MLNSIRTRLTLWYLAVLALILIAFALVIYLLVARNLSRAIDNNLAEIARSVEADLKKEEADIEAAKLAPVEPVEDEEEDDEKKQKEGLGEEVLTIEAAIAEEVEDLRSRDYGFLVLDKDGRQIASTITDAKVETELLNLPTELSYADLSGSNDVFRVHRKPLVLTGKPFQLLITRSRREQIEFLDSLRSIFLFAVPIALILAGLGGYFLARRSLAPVVSMSNQAEKIGSSNLNQRLPVKNEDDELGGLAKVFNALLGRLEESFEQQKQFMADASHELRTPLAIVRGESEVAISKEDRSAVEYRESLAIVHDESKRLTKIVEDLFMLARADSGQLKPQFTEVYLDEILADCIRHVRVLADKRSVSFDVSSDGEMPIQGDEDLLRQLFLNLLDNAIKYTRGGSQVFVSAERNESDFRITIIDAGGGIPVEDQARIFERFFRSDAARSREKDTVTSGAGLGLSIAQWVAEVHRAEIKLVRSDSSGSTFTVVFPEKEISLESTN